MTPRAEPSSTGDGARPHRRNLFSVLAISLLLAGCASAEFTDNLFEEYEVVTGSTRRQTVLPGFLLGGAVAELAVIDVDDDEKRRLRIYGLAGNTREPRLEATLRPEVLFVDVANIGGRDRLITFDGGRLSWFDPEGSTERSLVEVASSFKGRKPRGGELPHIDITKDLNGDGRDDLVVPDVDGFWVFVQNEAGAFADPVKLSSSNEARRSAEMALAAGSDGYRYDPWAFSHIHETDYNRDGRSDLIYWKDDHFEVHYQNESGLFAPQAGTFATAVSFDSDGLYSFGIDASGEEWTALHRLDDVNGDGVVDLVALSPDGASVRPTWSTSKSLVIMEPSYEVHFGARAPQGGTVFAAKADATIRSAGVQMEMQEHDFDRDGQKDVMLTTGEYSVLKLLRAFFCGSVPLELKFYRMQNGSYPDEPDAVRSITAGAPPWWQGRFYPSVLLGDVDGDQREDLLVQGGDEELHVFLGVPGPDLFAEQPLAVAVGMPEDEEHVWLADLNRDGKQDILLHRASTTEPHRVTALIAR